MQGFFTKEETRSSLGVRSRKSSCFSCGLHINAKSPKMEAVGNFKKKIMLLGEFPGEREDARNKPWQGKEGRILQTTLAKLGIDLFEDCISMYAVNCLPQNNNPISKEIDACRDVKVIKTVKEYNPRIIILLGNLSLISLIGNRWSKALGGIAKWRGWTIPDQELNAWVCPVFSPEYVLSLSLDVINVIWEEDLRRAISLKNLLQYEEPIIHYIEDLSVLDSIEKGMAAFDYETTGIKPYFKGHRIVCASIAYDENNVYTFIMPSKKSLREPFIRFLKNRKIKKIASNLKYEDQWSAIRLKTEVKGWFHDTMLAAHILDNRRGISGLKFQAFVQMGVVGYETEVDGYITKSRQKDNLSNAINRVQELLDQPGGTKQLLKYCALDSIYEYRLAQMQLKEMEIRTLPF